VLSPSPPRPSHSLRPSHPPPTHSTQADPIYVGERHRRVGGEPFEELVEELLRAVRARFGPSVLVDLQHMAWETSSRLLATYRGEFPMYSDGHHGLPALALAAVLAAGAGPLAAHRFVLVGDGPGVAAVAEVLEEAAQREARGGTVLEARGAIHLVDRAGLATRARADAGELADHQLPYIQDAPACPDLAAAVAHVKPTVIIGVSDGAPPFAFSQEVCAAAAAGAERPVMLALSLRGAGGAEGGAEGAAADVARWTGGAARFASRAEAGPLLDVLAAGVALGTLMSRSTRLPEVMFVEAARAVARCVSAEDRAAGRLLPRAADGRDVAAAVAAAVAERAYASGVATELPKPHALAALAERYMYDPTYRRYK
jgi:malate dehydrogenase (oxaloacetate-decarboxylating)(NADP+)